MITHNLGRSLPLLLLYSPMFPVVRRNRVATICLETRLFSVFLDFQCFLKLVGDFQVFMGCNVPLGEGQRSETQHSKKVRKTGILSRRSLEGPQKVSQTVGGVGGPVGRGGRLLLVITDLYQVSRLCCFSSIFSLRGAIYTVQQYAIPMPIMYNIRTHPLHALPSRD